MGNLSKLFLALLIYFVVFNHQEKLLKLPEPRELECLITNVYYEARGESYEGKVAVAKVTINRVNHPKYPKTICGVVYQPKQFSWTIKPSKAKVNPKEWYESAKASIEAYNMEDGLQATHYHNFTVSPKWNLQRVVTIGNHIFYI